MTSCFHLILILYELIISSLFHALVGHCGFQKLNVCKFSVFLIISNEYLSEEHLTITTMSFKIIEKWF